MKMKKNILFSMLAVALLFSSCGEKKNHTAEEWIDFSKNNTEFEVIYDKLSKMAPEDIITIYGELSLAVGNGISIKDYSAKDVSLAYWYIYAFIPVDSDVHKDRYSLALMDKFESIMKRQTDLDAMDNSFKYVGEDKMIEILRTFAQLSGSQKHQNFWRNH